MVVPRLVSATAGPTVVPLRDLRMAARRLAVLTVVPMVVPKDLLTVGLSRTRPTAVLTVAPTVGPAGAPEVGEYGVGDRAAARRAPGSPALCSR